MLEGGNSSRTCSSLGGGGITLDSRVFMRGANPFITLVTTVAATTVYDSTKALCIDSTTAFVPIILHVILII